MQRAGINYEKVIGKELSKRFNSFQVFSEQWIEFLDINGHGFAQPDHYIVTPYNVLAFECKLSQRDDALVQLGGLYRPLLREIYSLPVVGIQVCKILRKDCNYFISDPITLLGITSEGIYTWHWLG